MRDDVYKNIMRILRSVAQDTVPHSRKCMEILQKAYPTIPELTLESIYTLYYQRRMRIRHFKCKEMAEELYHRYNSAVANGESRILLRMSLEFDLAPALLARLILDQHFLSEDSKFNKCRSTLLVRSRRPLPPKLPSVSEASSASHSLSERTKSSENTVSEVSDDISVEECSETSKLSDDILETDVETATAVISVMSKVHKDKAIVPAECEDSLPPVLQNGKLKQQQTEIIQLPGHVNNEGSAQFKSDELQNEKIVATNCIKSTSYGCPKSSGKYTNLGDQMTECRSKSSLKLGESEALQLTESCHLVKDSSEDITRKKQETDRSEAFEVPQIVNDSFIDKLQELKNKLIHLKLETKKMSTDRPTTSDEAGIEFSGMKRSVSRLMKDTTLIQDKILANEISMCVLYDDQYGPAATTYKHSLGQEYEVKLIKHAKAADLTFHLEARLRERGFDKTPDLLLIYPIAIGCNVVNWIESKALFADREVHNMYFVHQYERYCSRYGPGLVIYWFGFVESLREDDPFILVRDNFPKYIKHMNLLVDDASDYETCEDSSTLTDWEVAEPSSEEMTKFLERFSN